MNIASVLSDPQYPCLKSYVLDRTGLHYYFDRDEDLATRMSRRMNARAVRNCAEYMGLLEADASRGGEWDALVGEITIGETYFFRQADHFELLRTTIVPDLIARKQHLRRLSIWSAGCATGAEPYSIALLLRLEFGHALRGWDVSILATDLNADFLAQARRGRFSNWALREVPEPLRRRCFQQDGSHWVLAPEFRELVRFEYHNLASGVPYPGTDGAPIDIIVCRNVLIYFSREQIRAVALRFFEVLAPGGWLLVGHAEPDTVAFDEFEMINNGRVTVYRKPLGGDRQAQPPWTPFVFTPDPVFTAGPPPEVEPAAVPIIAGPSSSTELENARALADEGEWKEAEQICRKLIARDPLNSPAHFSLGTILAQTGAVTDAMDCLRRAIYLDRQFALAHYHVGLLLQDERDRVRARKAFSNVAGLLRELPDDEMVPHGDGIRVGELRQLAAMHMETAADQ